MSLITCFQTIEHLPDPLAFCRNAWRALKPGALPSSSVINRRALSARIMGFKSPIFDVEHLQLFSPRSFHALLETAGFEGAEVRPILNRYPIRYLPRLSPVPAIIKNRALDWLGRSRAGRWVIPLPAGNLAAIAFRSR